MHQLSYSELELRLRRQSMDDALRLASRQAALAPRRPASWRRALRRLGRLLTRQAPTLAARDAYPSASGDHANAWMSCSRR